MQAGRKTHRLTGMQARRLTGMQASKKTYRQTDKQTDRHAGRQEDMQTDRHTDRQTDRNLFWFVCVRVGALFFHQQNEHVSQRNGRTQKHLYKGKAVIIFSRDCGQVINTQTHRQMCVC